MNLHEYLLTKLNEELLESAHAVSKAQTFGLNDENPKTPGVPNKANIMQEFIEAQALLEMCYEAGIDLPRPNSDEIEFIKAGKKAKVVRYMQYSRDRGMLEPKGEDDRW